MGIGGRGGWRSDLVGKGRGRRIAPSSVPEGMHALAKPSRPREGRWRVASATTGGGMIVSSVRGRGWRNVFLVCGLRFVICVRASDYRPGVRATVQLPQRPPSSVYNSEVSVCECPCGTLPAVISHLSQMML